MSYLLKVTVFYTTHTFGAPVEGDSLEFYQDLCYQKTRMFRLLCSIACLMISLAVLTFGTTLVCNRQ